MAKMVCVKCEVELVIKKYGVITVEYFSDPPQPYRLMGSDLFSCPKCGIEIVAGFAQEPIAEHYEEKFNSVLDNIMQSPAVIVNDYEWPPVS